LIFTQVAARTEEKTFWAKVEILDVKNAIFKLTLSFLQKKKLWYGVRTRANQRDVFFDLKIEDIVIPKTCPALGIPIEPIVGKGRIDFGKNWNSPTIDRVDPTRGYVPDNIRVISYRANFLKNEATADELEAIARYIREHQIQAI